MGRIGLTEIAAQRGLFEKHRLAFAILLKDCLYISMNAVK
jgi:hypothetical protein